MCILCVIQKWSRRVATMLPWLLFPILGLWVFSHLLPPGFRFEFTSPRIACVLVLLVTVFWYEVLMPQLSAWRARNSAKYREMKRREAIEMQKLRKFATRLCRNCLTTYRDQNPCGGKFMCSYCGHVSKRPVLIPSGSGGDVDIKGGRKECLGIGYIYGHDDSQNVNSSGGYSAFKSNRKAKNMAGTSSGNNQCFAATQFSVLAGKASNRIFLKFACFWRNIFGLAVEDDISSDGDDDMLFKEGQNEINFQESRGEKARRKAEEKRQARLERELLEEEERKQREEVAKLVEEQRKLRDEKMDAEKKAVKGTASKREKCSKRKHHERRKERDKWSSKSNSDREDSERKGGKFIDKKREFDRKSDSGRMDLNKTMNLCVKVRNSDVANVPKVSTTQNLSNGNSARYLDRVKGSFMSSSKAFNGATFFGKGSLASGSVSSKAGHHIDDPQTASSRKEIHNSDHVHTKENDKISKTDSYQTVALESQPQVTPQKSWRQLFTRSTAVLSSQTESCTVSNRKIQSIAQSSSLPGQSSSSHPLSEQINFGLPLPFSLSSFPNGSTGSSPISSSVTEPVYSCPRDLLHGLKFEEPDIFEDPCYVPDLLGPVSESLDNFSLDLGSGPIKDKRVDQPHDLKYLSPSFEISKPSPIKAPAPRLRFVEEKHTNSNSYPSTSKRKNANTSHLIGSTNEHEDGTWKMWSTPPLGQDGFGLMGGSGSWLLPLGQKSSSQEEVFPSPAYNTLTLPFHKENQVHSGTSSPQGLHLGSYQNGGPFSLLAPGPNDNDCWLQRNIFQPSFRDGQDQSPQMIPWEDSPQKNVTFCASSNSPSGHSSELSPANRWLRKDSAVNGAGEGTGNPLVSRPHIGGLYSTPDVESLWSYN